MLRASPSLLGLGKIESSIHRVAYVKKRVSASEGLKTLIQRKTGGLQVLGLLFDPCSCVVKWTQTSVPSDLAATRFPTPDTQFLRVVIGFCGSALELGG